MVKIRKLRNLLIFLMSLCLISAASTESAAQPEPPFPPVQPGEMEAYEGGMYTSSNLTQTINGVTVYVMWTYADSWMVQVGSVVRGGGRPISAMLRLRTDDYPGLDLGDGYIGTEAHWFQWRYPSPFSDIPFDPAGQMPFYDNFETFPKNLSFELTVRVRMPDVAPTPNPDAPTLAPEVTPDPTPIPQPVFQDFKFEFSVRPYPVRILKPNVTMESDTLTVTINQLAITPIKTIIDLCYQVKDTTENWYLGDIDTYYGENVETIYERFGGVMGQFSRLDESGCSRYEAPLFSDLVSSPFTLEIGHIFTGFEHSDAKVLAMQRHLADKGLEMTIRTGSDGRINGFSWPPEVTFEEVAIEMGFMKRIDGPWRVTVPIPPETP